MRDYTQFDEHLNKLADDIYPQKADPGHTEWARKTIQELSSYFDDCENVLDVGCGTGFCEPIWRGVGLDWTGVTLGKDADKAIATGRPIVKNDMSFLFNFGDNSFDVVFARHVLEHSPFPVITLMEWRRVSRQFLFLVAPTPEHWGYRGRNHYSVMGQEQLYWLCERAGWELVTEVAMENHSPEYLATLPNETERNNARRIRPPIKVEYRMIFEMADPKFE